MPEMITLEQAQTNLAELIAKLVPGEEVVITRNEQPIAKLIRQTPPLRQPRHPGSAKGKLVILADDDEHLADFQEYM